MNNLYSLLENAARQGPHRVFVDFLGHTYSYAQMKTMADAVAVGLQQSGLKPGERVALCLPNCPYYVAFFYGVLKAGGVLVNMNPLYTEAEMETQLTDSGARLVVTVDVAMMTAKLLPLQQRVPGLNVLVCPLGDCMPPLKKWFYKWLTAARVRPAEGVFLYHRFVSEGIKLKPATENGKTPPQNLGDLALLQYTGGTTGLPKAAMLSHANLLANTAQCVDRLCEEDGDGGGRRLRGAEKIMGVLPLFHVFALTSSLLMGAALGATLILLPRFTPASLLRAIKSARPTLLPGVPALFDALARLPGVTPADFASVKLGVSGGAPLPPAVKARFEDACGLVLREGYGLTEASPVVACTLPSQLKPGSVGLPLKDTQVEIRVEGQPVKTLETGEIWVKGPQVMAGYWDRAAETEAVLQRGWLFTGDLGHVDADGWLFVTDRLKDLIIVNGYKVYPRMVEEVLQTHPGVAEVVVAGIPHPHKGEVPKAFIKVTVGATLTVAEISDYAATRLNPMERPAEIEFRDSLPKTLIGKPTRKGLV